jgi:type I restriction enzyme S subunit
MSKKGHQALCSRESGTTVTGIKQSELRKVKVTFPPIEVQKKIASVISSFDDKIAVNHRICENLEAQAQALFKSWFIDFEPFKNGKFVESELGMIPEGWKVATLSEYVDNFGGYSYKGNELQPSTTAMATIKNFVRGGGFKTDGYKEIVISKNIKDYQYVKLFDVLVAHTDLTQNAEVVGNPAIVLSTAGYEKLIMSMDLTKVVPKDSRLTSPLVHQILSTPKFKEHALGYVNGTTVLHMNKKAVPDYILAMPSDINVLKDLASVLDDLYRLMSEKYAENIALATLRDTLLPKLMSGQITL